jgi:hypothetical protein
MLARARAPRDARRQYGLCQARREHVGGGGGFKCGSDEHRFGQLVREAREGMVDAALWQFVAVTNVSADVPAGWRVERVSQDGEVGAGWC